MPIVSLVSTSPAVFFFSSYSHDWLRFGSILIAGIEDKSGQKQQKKSTPETRRLAAAIVGSCISRSSHGTEWGLSLNRMKLVPALQGFVNREALVVV